MKGEMKLNAKSRAKLLLVTLGVGCLALTADACTGMYAGKKATADGSVLIGRTVDFSPYNATMYQQICEAGTQMAVEWPRLIDAAVKTCDLQRLSDCTFAEEERSFAAAKRLYDELLWYMAANNRISGDGSGATDRPESPFKPRLRKSFAGEHDTEFGGIRIQADADALMKAALQSTIFYR